MYKDKSKQREAAAERMRRLRAQQKAQHPEGATSKAQQGISVTPEHNFENCRVCGVLLPPLETPRQSPGMCINCVTDKYHLKQPHVSQTVNRAEDVKQEQPSLEAELAALHSDLDGLVGL